MKTQFIIFLFLFAASQSLLAQHKLIFLEPMAGLWVPKKNYNFNHAVCLQLGLEGGKRVLQFGDKVAIGLLGGVLFSPQKLKEHLVEEKTTMLQAYVGSRLEVYPSENLNLTFTLGGGLINEWVTIEPGHTPPSWDWHSVLGIGAGKWLNEFIRIGVRLDLVSTKEGGQKNLGWVNGLMFAGFNF